MKVLVTGSTGFIGQRLVRELSQKGHELYLLIRPQSKKKAQDIFKDLEKITIIEGDIEDTDVVKNITSVSNYLNEIESLVHTAAFYHLEAGLSRAYVSNVIGTQNIIHLMSKMTSLKHFFYFSTYAVNPLGQGLIREDDLIEEDLLLPDYYSKTKNHAEHIVRKQTPKNIQTIIFRPGTVIGDSKTGIMDKKDGPYYYFDFIETLKKLKLSPQKIPFLPIPTTENSFFPVIPVDVLADWCAHIISHPPKERMRCYHLVPNPPIKTKEFLEEAMKLQGFPVKILPIKYTKLVAPLLPIVSIPKEAAVYMNQQTDFDRSQFNADYPDLKCPAYQDYLPTLINQYLRHVT